jgi:hypothetical protein
MRATHSFPAQRFAIPLADCRAGRTLHPAPLWRKGGGISGLTGTGTAPGSHRDISGPAPISPAQSSSCQAPRRLMSRDSSTVWVALPCTTRTMARPRMWEEVKSAGKRRKQMGKTGRSATMPA